jgi:hypothetical protein
MAAGKQPCRTPATVAELATVPEQAAVPEEET